MHSDAVTDFVVIDFVVIDFVVIDFVVCASKGAVIIVPNCLHFKGSSYHFTR